VEHEAANSNKKVPKIGDGKDGVVAMLSAAFDTFVCKVQEEQIGQRIDNLGRVVRCIVFLLPMSVVRQTAPRSRG
jgi:hypothetical protein